MSPRSRRHVLQAAGGALAGASLVGVAARPSRAGGATGRARTDTPTDTPGSRPTTPTVEFDAQQVENDGLRVTVELAVLPDGGFVAVHEGDPTGPIIGVSDHLPAGTHRHVAVDLSADSPVRTRRELSAVLFRDTDGDEAFDFVAGFDDTPYVVDDEPIYDTALVFVPTPTPTPEPEPTVSLNFTQVPTGTPSPAASPPSSPTDPPTATEAADAIPGFGVVAALVAAGAGTVAAWRRG